MKKIRKVKYCRICNSEKIAEFLPLGNITLPNGFLKEEAVNKKEERFPLNVGLCLDCGLAQLMEIVDPEIMFRNYVYIPSSSKTRMQNFEEIAKQGIDQVNPPDSALVIDIGSNDGSLLSYFKGHGMKTLGVDPASNLAKIAELKGINTINDYINPILSKKILKAKGPAHIITATNVVAHINNIHELFTSIRILLHDDGVFICEFPYLRDLIEKNQFDTIYHEHLSYFSIKPLAKLISDEGLYINDIKRTTIDGGSIRLFIGKKESSLKTKKMIKKLLKDEETIGLSDFNTLKKFTKKVGLLKKQLVKTLKILKRKNKTIASYGAAAKGNILLNYCSIDNKLIDFMVDSTIYKQGLYTPGTHIKIYPENEIIERKPDYVLITAWNFAKEIIEKEKKYTQSGGKFIIPVPDVTIVE